MTQYKQTYKIYKDMWLIVFFNLVNFIIVIKSDIVLQWSLIYVLLIFIIGFLGIIYTIFALLGKYEIRIEKDYLIQELRIFGLFFSQNKFEKEKLTKAEKVIIDRATYWGFQGFAFSEKCSVLKFRYKNTEIYLGRWYSNFDPAIILTYL